MADIQTLADGLDEEIIRVEELKKRYLELPNGAGCIAARLMEQALENAKEARKNSDVLGMLNAFQSLQEFEL